jgi:hypothetical protein
MLILRPTQLSGAVSGRGEIEARCSGLDPCRSHGALGLQPGAARGMARDESPVVVQSRGTAQQALILQLYLQRIALFRA